MAVKTGTFDVASLLANKQTTAATFGLENIATVLQNDIAVQNRVMNGMIQEFAERTTERLMLVGASDSGDMVEVDQFGRSRTQKPAVGANLGVPLRLFQYAVGWTRKYFEQTSVADVVLRASGGQKAYRKKVILEMKRAIYRSANYTFRDRLVAPVVDLPVKRFANADSFGIPEGPNGETFDASTHQHYTFNATLTAPTLLAHVNNVAEHTNTGALQTYINSADEAAVSALTGFKPATDIRFATGNTDGTLLAPRLDYRRMNDRAIGTFGPSEVWVKPWAIANYAVTLDTAAPQKALAFRQRTNAADAGLGIAAELDAFPLHAQYMEAEFGIAVQNRVAGAVFYFAGGAYADPTL